MCNQNGSEEWTEPSDVVEGNLSVSHQSRRLSSVCVIRMVARSGQSLQMLLRATCLFQELSALLASTSSTASFLSDSKAVCTACTAALILEICPPHSWRHPEISCTSGLAILSIALAIIHLAMSPMPIGRTPRLLSKAIRRQRRRGETHLGST